MHQVLAWYSVAWAACELSSACPAVCLTADAIAQQVMSRLAAAEHVTCADGEALASAEGFTAASCRQLCLLADP